jgi:hypothetical protein
MPQTIPELSADQYYILNLEWAGLDSHFTYKDMFDQVTDWYEQSNIVRFLQSNYNPFYIRNVIVNTQIGSEPDGFDPFDFETRVVRLALDYTQEFLAYNQANETLLVVSDAMILAYPKYFENWLMFPILTSPHSKVLSQAKELRDMFEDPIDRMSNFGLMMLLIIVLQSHLDHDKPSYSDLHSNYRQKGLTQLICKTRNNLHYDLWEFGDDFMRFYKRYMSQDFILVPLPFTKPVINCNWHNDPSLVHLLAHIELFEDYLQEDGIMEVVSSSMPFEYDFSKLRIR